MVTTLSSILNRAIGGIAAAILILSAGGAVPLWAGETVPLVGFGAFIAQHRSPTATGPRIIPVKPEPVRFVARVMRYPESVRVEYLYEVLGIMGVSPMPQVSHRMFLQGEDGTIHPVYVQDDVVAPVRAAVAVGDQAEFQGVRVYDYAKGPAILVRGVRRIDG